VVSALGEDISDAVIHPEEKVKVKVRPTKLQLNSSDSFVTSGTMLIYLQIH